MILKTRMLEMSVGLGKDKALRLFLQSELVAFSCCSQSFIVNSPSEPSQDGKPVKKARNHDDGGTLRARVKVSG